MSSSSSTFDPSAALNVIEERWSDAGGAVLKTLQEYISIPNQSPAFDAEWETNGHQDKAVSLLSSWVRSQLPLLPAGATVEVLTEKGRTPLIYMEVPGTNNAKETVLMYGHMDKQPPMTSQNKRNQQDDWWPGYGPYSPKIVDGKLYGRGGADDGYAVFGVCNALQALKQQGGKHARIVMMIEACEESGSRDLLFWLESKKANVGIPNLVICLDSGCHNYEQMWGTTSLRGLMMGTLKVEVLTESVHSGMASGVVPSSFRIIRELLDRVEDSKTGKLLDCCYANPIPEVDRKCAAAAGEAVGKAIYTKFPWAGETQPVSTDAGVCALGYTWMPALSVTGQSGMAPIDNAGNVLRTHTALRLSLRTPPNVEAKDVGEEFKKVLEANPPYNAKVSFIVDKAQKGWQSPPLAPWLDASLQRASQFFFKKPAMFTGEGGSIPFMGLLSDMFPEAQFVITGILGPSSNAHGPNEFLHIDFTKRLIGCVSSILSDHYDATVAK